ncbi:hypothetical protein TELCIR_17387, partial [Teladorsagia circumcincta]
MSEKAQNTKKEHYEKSSLSALENDAVSGIRQIPASDGGQGSFEFYETLLETFENKFVGDITLKGAFFNVKNAKFIHALRSDAKIAAVSAALVLVCFLLYSCSFLYTVVILIIIFLSMGVALFFYTAKEEPYQIGDPYVPRYKERDRVIQAIRSSLRHSLASMFVTSATTAVAFVSNLSSAIIVLRCFGVFASLTMMANFILVVFVLPSTMVLTCSERHLNLLPDLDVATKLSRLLYRARYIVVVLGVTATLFASVIVFVTPGLEMPRYNPTKLLSNSDPYEWFDNNEHMFNFDWKRKWKFMENYVIGVDEKSGAV